MIITLRKQKPLIFIGCLGLVLLFSLDLYLERPLLLADDPPLLSAKWLMKSFVLFISLALIFYGLTNFINNKKSTVSKTIDIYELITILVVLFISSFFVFLYSVTPKYFHIISYEDGPIELASAFFLFISSIIFFVLWVRCFFVGVVPKITQYSFLIFSFLFFIICMEEISWFQRVADIETPVYFENNIQKEMNFHNFFTHSSEYIYYIGSFVFLVLFPFFKLVFNEKIKDSSFIQTMTPQYLLIPIGFVMCSYNYDMWNSTIIQITFFSSLLLSIIIVQLYTKKNQIILYSVIIILVTTQIIFLIPPNNYDRLHEIKEFKEFFISFGFLIYSIDVYKNSKKRSLD